MSMNLCTLSRLGRRIVAAFAYLAVAAGPVLGTPGQLDPTFLGTGMRVLPEGLGFVYPMSFAIQPDNKILLAGYGAPGQFFTGCRRTVSSTAVSQARGGLHFRA